MTPTDLSPHGIILMSYPGSTYDLKYKINDWMDPSKNKINKQRANDQWLTLVNLIARLGSLVDIISVPEPDGVFSANAGLVYGDKFILSNFKFEERKAEESYWLEWSENVKHPTTSFNKLFKSIHIIEEEPFEGAGDALFIGDTLVCGYGFRSSFNSTQIVKDILDAPVLPLELINPKFYHLDTCFCPLADNQVMYYPPAFKNPEIIENNFDTIVVSQADAQRFACNSVLIDKTIIIPSQCLKTVNQLKQKGYNSYSVDLSEYLLTGGAAKCLTLRYW